MEKRKVFLSGGGHNKAVGNEIAERISKRSIDAVFSEDIQPSDLNWKLSVKDPLGFITLLAWGGALERIGGDIPSLKRICKEQKVKVPFHNDIDFSFEEVMQQSNIFINYLFAAVCILIGHNVFYAFLTLVFIFLPVCVYLLMPIVLGISVITTLAFYMAYILARTFKPRNRKMVKETMKRINEKGYRTILFYSGSAHTNHIHKLFRSEDVVVEIIQPPSIRNSTLGWLLELVPN